jgi:uncharacterized membrane protein
MSTKEKVRGAIIGFFAILILYIIESISKSFFIDKNFNKLKEYLTIDLVTTCAPFFVIFLFGILLFVIDDKKGKKDNDTEKK